MDKNITKDKVGRMKQKAGSMTRTAFTFAQLWLSRRYATKVDREAFDLQHKMGASHRDTLFKAGPSNQLICNAFG